MQQAIHLTSVDSNLCCHIALLLVVVVVVCLFQAESYKHYKNQYIIYNNK